MALFSNDDEDLIRQELLKKSLEISKNVKEVTEEDIKQNQEEEKNPIKILTDNGIDAESAIDILGDEEIFKERIREFASVAKSKYGKLMDCKVSMNMTDYARESTELKTLANYLGIDNLFVMAKIHESKAKRGDTNYIIEHFKEYEDEIMKEINIVNEYLREV